MKVALVSSHYLSIGGTERVDSVFGKMFPQADVFTLFANEQAIPEALRGHRHTRSFLQDIPGIQKLYRAFFPLYPYAIRSLDLRGYDLVISSDHGAMKGVLTDQNTTHICYCHTPWRQVWDLYYKSLEIVPKFLRPAYVVVAERLREWDWAAAQRVDMFAANSRYIAQRIRKFYNRRATVIYPPVHTRIDIASPQSGDYYLSVGRLTHTKRVDILVEACNILGRRLIVAGTGREEKRLKTLEGKNIEFLGPVSDADLKSLYANCRALLFAADEDFGIVPVEAQAYGKPVIAYGHGGSLETVRVNDPEGAPDTGVYFNEQTPESAAEGIRAFERVEPKFDPREIRAHAHRFDTQSFESQFSRFISTAIEHKRRTDEEL